MEPTPTPGQPPQPDAQFVIQALHDELANVNQNRIYLLACLNQMQSEARDAHALWALERESLVAALRGDESPADPDAPPVEPPAELTVRPDDGADVEGS